TAAGRGDGAAYRAYEYGVAVSLYTPGLGADPHGGPSLCADLTQRTDAAPRVCGSIRGAPAHELYDLPTATLIRPALQQTSPVPPRCHAPESGWETGSSRPSPGALAADHSPGAAA